MTTFDGGDGKDVKILSDTLISHLAYEEHELVEPLARLGFYEGQL